MNVLTKVPPFSPTHMSKIRSGVIFDGSGMFKYRSIKRSLSVGNAANEQQTIPANRECKALAEYKSQPVSLILSNVVIGQKKDLCQADGKYLASFLPKWIADLPKKGLDDLTLGRHGQKQFMIRPSDAGKLEGCPSVELPLLLGYAPFTRELTSSCSVFLLLVPINHIEAAKPQAGDSDFQHFMPEGGKTAVKLGVATHHHEKRFYHSSSQPLDSEGHIVGVEEFVTPGGQAMPSGSHLIKILNSGKGIGEDIVHIHSWS